MSDTHLVGGIHRDVTGRANEPLRFYLTISRGLKSGKLKSGKLDTVEVDEGQILRLIVEAAQALEMLRAKR